MTKKKSKTNVAANNRKQAKSQKNLMWVEKNFSNQCDYLFDFDTMQEAHIFSALLFNHYSQLFFTTNKNFSARILASKFSNELLEKAINNRINFWDLEDESKPIVSINLAFKNKEILKSISELLDICINDKAFLKDYVDKHFLNGALNLNFVGDPLSFRADRDFKKDFLNSLMIESLFSVGEGINFYMSTDFCPKSERVDEFLASQHITEEKEMFINNIPRISYSKNYLIGNLEKLEEYKIN